MKRTWMPNAISFVSIACGWAGIVFGLGGSVPLALLFISLAAVGQALDGEVADRLNSYSKHAEVLQSIAGAVVNGAVVATLLKNGAWPWWSLLVVLVPVAGFTLVHVKRKEWPGLKWAQNFLHPLFSVGLTFVGIVAMLNVLVPTGRFFYTFLVVVATAAAGVFTYLRWERIDEWFHWDAESESHADDETS